MNILFLFLDGVGMGDNNPDKNPFVSVKTPTLDHLLSGRKIISENAPFTSKYCSMLSIDAHMDVAGLPQSATGQATLLTGLNFPEILGYHYGPKPNPEISRFFEPNTLGDEKNLSDKREISIFAQLSNSGKKACLMNAYPPSYFESIKTRKRNHSLIPLAVTSSGIRLFDQTDLILGKALSADFTGQGWHDHLNIQDIPILDPVEAGSLMAYLSNEFRFSMFEFWETDLVGHRQDFSKAHQVIAKFDLVLKGLLANWDYENNGILVTSDHGNLEDLSTRRHTNNQVPALFIGPPALQPYFSNKIHSIGDIAPFILELLDD